MHGLLERLIAPQVGPYAYVLFPPFEEIEENVMAFLRGVDHPLAVDQEGKLAQTEQRGGGFGQVVESDAVAVIGR